MVKIGDSVILRITAREEHPATVVAVRGDRIDLDARLPSGMVIRYVAIPFFLNRRASYEWIAKGLDVSSRVSFPVE